MSNTFLKTLQATFVLFILTFLSLCVGVSTVSADSPSGPGGSPSGAGGSPSGAGGSPAGDGPLIDVSWNNPLGDGVTIEQVIVRVLEALIILATPIITLMIIYAGFMYVTARGNAEQVKKASAALTFAIIGGIMVIGAVAITGIIEQTVSEFRPAG